MRSFILSFLCALLFSQPALGALYTIGPAGVYPSLSAAVTDAIANPDNHEFRLQVGVYTESVSITISGEKIWGISGGWNNTFTNNNATPNQTTLQAGPFDTVLRFFLTDNAQLQVGNLQLTGGLSTTYAGGVDGSTTMGSIFAMQDCIVSSNQSSTQNGGMRLLASQTSVINLSNIRVLNNAVFGTGIKFGAGAYIRATNAAFVSIARSEFSFNQDSEMSSGSFGLGLYVDARDAAYLSVSDSIFEENTALANVVTGIGFNFLSTENADINIEGVRVLSNAAPSATMGVRAQAYASINNTSDFVIRDSLIANSALAGLSLAHNGTGRIEVSNCTIANHLGIGLGISSPSGAHVVVNSIIHNNFGSSFGIVTDASVSQINNLGDDVAGVNNVDPLFVNPSSDFHLQNNSPAIDTGNNAYVFSGIDLDLNPRIFNDFVDIGAYESQALPLPDTIFANGLEDGA